MSFSSYSSRMLDISVLITYKPKRGSSYFKFKSRRLSAALRDDTKDLGFPSHAEHNVNIIEPERIVEIVWRDVKENVGIHRRVQDLIQPITREKRRIWKEKLDRLEIEDVKLQEHPLDERSESSGYRGKRSRPSESSEIIYSTDESPHKKVRRSSYSDQRPSNYDEVGSSGSRAEVSSRTRQGIQTHSVPTLVERVGLPATSERPPAHLAERISPAPVALQNRLADRIATDATPQSGTPLSSRISDLPPSSRKTHALSAEEPELSTAHQIPPAPMKTRSLSRDTRARTVDGGAVSTMQSPKDGTRSSHTPQPASQLGKSSSGTSIPAAPEPASPSPKPLAAADAAEVRSSDPHTARSSLLHCVEEAIGPPKHNDTSAPTMADDNDDVDAALVEAAVLLEGVPPSPAPKAKQPSSARPTSAPMDIDIKVPPINTGDPASSGIKPNMNSANDNDSLEVQLAKMDRVLRSTQQELERERCLRKEAEAKLEDWKRECSNPDIVPALFDAFMQISKLTTKAQQKPDPA